MFDHPRLGRALARAFDDAGERALITRSRRWGYDLRTVDRALVAWEAAQPFMPGSECKCLGFGTEQ